MNTPRNRSDALAALLRREHHAMADFLLALADLDREKVWQALGHASLFSYLRRELGLSAGAAQYRKTAAELVQRFPPVERALREGRLCLSSVIELAKVLTPENEAEVLPRFFGLSARDAAAVAVSLVPVPNPPVREVVTVLRAAADRVLAVRPESVRTSETVLQGSDDRPLVDSGLDEAGPYAQSERTTGSLLQLAVPAAPSSPTPSSAPRAAPSPRPPPLATEPLSPDLARLHVNVSRTFLEKLDQARDALAHAMPGASAAEILEAGLDLLLAERDRRRATGRKPAAKKRLAAPDTITADVRRMVWERDQGRCQFPLEGGGICGSTYRLELDHIHPKALGGQPTVDDLRVACRPHNQLAARRAFGDAFIERKIRERRERTAPGQHSRGPQPPGDQGAGIDHAARPDGAPRVGSRRRAPLRTSPAPRAPSAPP